MSGLSTIRTETRPETLIPGSPVFVYNSIRFCCLHTSEDRYGGSGKGPDRRADCRTTGRFDMALSNKRKYPLKEFTAFVQSARRYIEITAGDPMIHRSAVQAVNGLREFLQLERKQIPGDILFEADRRECELFDGYDPGFAGHEPPGL
jgi:hypothetical protein